MAAGLGAAGAPGASATGLQLVVSGFGFGHGRGMGQWGAYGYASEYGWGYRQILGHYYGGTTLGTLPAPEPDISVLITELTGHYTIATAPGDGQLVANLPGGAAVVAPALEVRRSGATETVFAGPGCTGPWRKAGVSAGAVTIASALPGGSAAPAGVASSEVTLCLPGSGERTYQGQVVSRTDGRTYNVVGLEDYVDGVVPAESPVYWASSGGAAALEAQAVAARSFALAYVAQVGAVCDNTMCQVYTGLPDQWGPTADAEVSATAGQVLYCGAGSTCGQAGAVALAEYSASTGGYSAGGAFPAVADVGDSVAANPNHTWSVSVPLATVQARFPAVGTVASVTVTQRNGLGEIGGRATLVELTGSKGSIVVTGSQLAAALGLRSNWFALSLGGTPPSGSPATTTVPAATTTVPAATTTVPWGRTTTAPPSSTTTTVPWGRTTTAPPSSTTTTAPPSSTTTTRWRTTTTGPAVTTTAPASTTLPVLVGSGARAGAHGRYWVVTAKGRLAAVGGAPYYGGGTGTVLSGSIVAMAAAPGRSGYWLAGRRGGVLAYGHAGWYGSLTALHVEARVVAMASTPDGRGYWLVTRAGGVYGFGDARGFGSLAGLRTAGAVAGMAPTPDGRGYWLVTGAGGVYGFGDAAFFGSPAGSRADLPIAGIVPTHDGRGYWLVGRDGGVYAYGDAVYAGSLPGEHVRASVVSVAPAGTEGYRLLTADGRVFVFATTGGVAAVPVLATSLSGAAAIVAYRG
jgi:SpoIID/LytB domain protein